MAGVFSRRVLLSWGIVLVLGILMLCTGCTAPGTTNTTPGDPQSGMNGTAIGTGSAANSSPAIPVSNVTVTPTPPTRYEPLSVKAVPKKTDEERTFSFRYASQDFSVTLSVNMTLYRAANDSANQKAVVADGDLSHFYSAMIDDPAMDEFFNETGRRLEKMKYRKGNQMTEDDFLELLVSFVQQIRTDDAKRMPRYPVQVIADRSGTVAEKSILLAGLLAFHGYDSAVLIFPEKDNVAAGLHIQVQTKPSFRVFSDGRRDYIYIETGTTRLVGMYPDGYKTIKDPVIVRTGNGTMMYRKMDSIGNIMYDLATMKTSIGTIKEKQQSGQAMEWDEEALSSYEETIRFVESTNDRIRAIEAVRESELPHHSSCMTCV